MSGNARELRASGTLQGSGAGYGDVGALNMTSQYDVALPDFEAKRLSVRSRSDATFVEIGGTQIAQLNADATYAVQRLDFDATARDDRRVVSAKGEVLLHPDHREVHLERATIQTEGIVWQLAPGARPAMQYGDDRVAVKDLRLVSAGQQIEADGEVGKRDSRMDVRAIDVDLAQIDTLLLNEQRLAGRVNANATLTGSWDALVADGQVRVDQGAFRHVKYDSLMGTIKTRDRRATFDLRLQQTPTAWVTATGSVPLARAKNDQSADAPAPSHDVPLPGQELDVKIESSPVDLGLIEGFVSNVTNVTGTLQANLRIGGSVRDPHVNGLVEIRGGAFLVAASQAAHQGLDARIDFEDDLVKMSAFRVSDLNKHSLTMTGQLAMHERELGALQLVIAGEDFQVWDDKTGDVRLDTNLRVVGEARRPRIEGDVTLTHAALDVGAILARRDRPYSTEPIAFNPPTPTEAVKSVFDELAVDVRVNVPNDLIVKGNDLRVSPDSANAAGDINVTLGGSIRATKAPGDIVRLTGSMETVRGTYVFQGRRFDLVRGGSIRFDGLDEIDPALNLVAKRIISSVDATVQIGGRVSAPELTLSSRPPLDQADILSLIIFNQPANQLGEGQRVTLAQRAGALASGFVASSLAESIGDALNLDIFEIQTVSDDGGGPAVTLGDQFGQNLFLKVRRAFGAQSATELILEYQISELLRLQSTVADASHATTRTLMCRYERGGVDLIFVFSY